MDPAALGRYLRESREAKELTLEQAVRALRIRHDILESFEQGEFNVMDSSVRVRGMLRNYARFLSLEEDRVLQYYESANSNKKRRRFGRVEEHVEPIAARNITDTPPALPAVTITQTAQAPSDRLAGFLRNLALLLVSLAAIAVIAFVVIDRFDLLPDEPIVTVAPLAIAGSISATPTNTPTITPRATVITDTPAAALGIVGIQIDLEIQQRSWVSISVDDREQYIGFLEPGFTSTYTANDNVTVRAANAAALDIIYNGIQQQIFGARGQEVELVFTVTGVDVIQSDVQLLIPSETPIPQSNTEQASAMTPTSTAITDVAVQEQVTSIPTSALPSPTPLFPVNPPQNEAVVTNPVAAETSVGNPTEAASTTVSTPTVTEAVVTPSATPTSAAILPLRITPDNPTPTKTG
ncbi:MAG: RodZ domain-containing protein [Phototrophicaceae bacterium]